MLSILFLFGEAVIIVNWLYKCTRQDSSLTNSISNCKNKYSHRELSPLSQSYVNCWLQRQTFIYFFVCVSRYPRIMHFSSDISSTEYSHSPIRTHCYVYVFCIEWIPIKAWNSRFVRLEKKVKQKQQQSLFSMIFPFLCFCSIQSLARPVFSLPIRLEFDDITV